jgi:hypothetical protein
MDDISVNTLHIAKVLAAVEEAYVCMNAAMHFADYFMFDSEIEEGIEENMHKLEVALPNAKEWIDKAMEHIALREKELEI